MEVGEKMINTTIQFHHPLMPYVPEATKEALVDLINLTVIGDETAKQQLIQHLLTVIAKRCIGMILSVYPGYINELDDMVSEAALEIVSQVSNLSQIVPANNVDPTKFMNYIAVKVLQQVTEMLSQNELIPVPKTTKRRKWHQGKETSITVFRDAALDNIPSSIDSDFEVREALEEIISTPIERKIIELREAGYNDREIGELTGLRRQTVDLLRFNLYQRYLEVTQ